MIDLGRESPADDRRPCARRPVRPWEAAATSSRRPTSRGSSTCSGSTTSATTSSSAATTRWTPSIASRPTAGTQGYELVGVGVPKTVDNDLCGTDHTPGFGSAARYVALSVKQAGMLARDMKLRRSVRDLPDGGPFGRLAAGGRGLGQGRRRTTPRTSSSCRSGPSTRTASWPT